LGRSELGGGGGSLVVVVVSGAGTGSVSWICSPRAGAATPASAGAGAARPITVVVVTAAVVVVTTAVVDVTNGVVDVVDVVGALVRSVGAGTAGSPVGGRRASTTVTSTAWDPDGSDPSSYWLTATATTTATTTTAAATPYVILERRADTSCSSRDRTAGLE
jgi:hypothetical protein